MVYFRDDFFVVLEGAEDEDDEEDEDEDEEDEEMATLSSVQRCLTCWRRAPQLLRGAPYI